MDPWDTTNSSDHKYRRRDHRPPSFSSTLLEQIYNSIDDSSDVKKQNRAENRGCLQKILVNRREVPGDSVRSRNLKTVEPVFFKHSSSSSSDSSGLSSSSSESRSPPENLHPKPIRTTVERPSNKQERGSFPRTKSKALKMYNDLKKVKQPISPSGRLATFLNSIFTGNTKKPSKTNTSATCSTTSSFSRSCLSKTPSSSENSKRSVRFTPVNVVDEDYKQRESIRHHRNLEENRRVIEAAKELLRTFQKNKDVVKISVEEEEDDDGASCASSDLFELDNLSTIGIDRYREELPVYETTRLNRVISR